MKRLLLIVILVLPFQLIWAAAAPYCTHESVGSEPFHVGHHEHQHEKADGADSSENTLGAFDGDCEVCHLGCAGAVPVPPPAAAMALPHAVPIEVPVALRSHVPTLPERPNIARLA
jgi:hypothetical protein